MGESDIQKEIARYREELLALAARRPPQADKAGQEGQADAPQGSAPLAEGPAGGRSQGQAAAQEKAEEPQKGPLTPRGEPKAAGAQENAGGPAGAAGPGEMGKAAGSAPPEETACGLIEAPGQGQAGREPLREGALPEGQEGQTDDSRQQETAPPGAEEAPASPPEGTQEGEPSAGQQAIREQEDAVQAGPTGRLWVRVVTAHGLQPVRGALITVSLAGQQLQTLLTSMYSDEEGRAGCEVPLTCAPEGERPCAYCHIRVDKPGYFTCHAYRVPVYEGEPAAQCARLLPLPGAGRAGHAPRPAGMAGKTALF